MTFMEEIYKTDGIRLGQAEKKKHTKFWNIRTKTSENLKIYSAHLISTTLHLITRPYGVTRTVEHKTGTVIARTIINIMKLKEKKNLEQS